MIDVYESRPLVDDEVLLEVRAARRCTYAAPACIELASGGLMTHDDAGRAPVSQFFGIAIAMYRTDRTPPHFHAGYEHHEALISIDTLEFVEGWLPKRAYALVLEWAAQHRAELRANWDRARQGNPLERIVPLE